MKKLLLGVITFALIITSCNKYADDFQELKDSIAALDAKVAGVATLQTNLTAVTAQITALQTAVAALPTTASITTLTNNLAAVALKVDGLTTTLNTVAATGTATKGVVDALTVTLNKLVTDQAAANLAFNTKLDGLKTDLAKAATSVEVQAIRTEILNKIIANSTTTDQNVNAQIAALKTALEADINAGGTTVNQKLDALNTLVTTSNAAQTAAINATIAALISDPNGDTATSNTIKGLQLALAAAKSEIDTILASTAMYNGDVVLTVDADVDFFLPKLSQLPIVNGSVTVNPTAISAAKRANLATILSKIGAVIGTTTGVTVTNGSAAADGLTFTALTSVKGFVTVTSGLAGSVNFPALTSIGGTYTVTGADALEPALVVVGGSLIWNFDGAYTSTTLASVGAGMTLTSFTTGTPAGTVGTTSVSFPSLTVTGAINGGVLTFPSAATIDVKSTADITTVTAANATSVKLRNTTYAGGISITPKSTATVDLSAATSVAGGVTIANGTTILLGNAATGGALNITTVAAGTVDLTKFNSNVAVTIAGTTNVNLPALVAGTLTFPNATTVTLAKYAWAAMPTMPSVVTMTLGAVLNPVTIALGDYPALTTASITGKAVTTIPMPTAAGSIGSVDIHNHALTTLTLAGTLSTAMVNHCIALTSLTTSGVINGLTVQNCPVLPAIAMGHTHYIGGPGSSLDVNNNTILASLVTSVDYMTSLNVVSNPALASANFASYVTKTISGNPTITINSNKLAFTYTNAVAATVTTPYVETVITSAALSSLKAYVALYTAPTLSLNLDYIGTTATTLSSKMGADANHLPAFIAPATGITAKAELALVQ